MYTKLNLLPAKIAAKNSIKPAFQHVMFDGNRTVATDTFRLLEVSTLHDMNTEPTFLEASLVKKHKVPSKELHVNPADIGTPNPHVVFPNVDIIMKEKVGVEYTTVEMNAELLGGLLLAMGNMNKFKSVTIKVPTNSTYEATHIYAHTDEFTWDTNAEGVREKKYNQTAHGLMMPLASRYR